MGALLAKKFNAKYVTNILTKDRTEAISIAKKNKAQVYKGKEIIKDYSEQKKPQ